MIVLFIFTIHLALSHGLRGSIYGRYEPYITYFIKGFTPPLSLFRTRPFPIDHTKGDKYRTAFQNAYGMHGEHLVSAYGRGLHKEQLLRNGLL